MTIQHDPSNVNNPEHQEHHVVGPVTYGLVFGTLLLCTLITVLAAQVEMGVFNAVVALAIACFKGVIVILFFMHVKVSVAPDQDDSGRCGFLHLPGAGDDVD